MHRIIYAAPETFILKCVKLHRVNKIKDLATMQPMKRLSKAPETFILKCVKLHRVNKIKDLATMQPMKRLSKAVPALTAGV